MNIKPRIDLVNRTKLETVLPLSTPFIIFVDPSDICNFRCKFCPTGDKRLMGRTQGRNHGVMDFKLYQKILSDISAFDKPIKVLRLYKDGEPFLNRRLPDMIQAAKDSGCCERIDTTTNASLLTPEINRAIVKAGLNRINISIEGINKEQYDKFSGHHINFEKLVYHIRDLYENRNQCEIIIKTNGDILGPDDDKRFYDIFGEIADGVSIEHVMSCWPNFKLKDVEVNTKVGIYGQDVKEVQVCPYIFYSFSVNSNGWVSACFLDWARRLIIGDAQIESLKDIWNGEKLKIVRKIMLQMRRKNHLICGNCGQMSHGMPDDIDYFAKELMEKL